MLSRKRLIALLSLCLLFLASCTPPTPPLRIGINAWPGYEFLYLAQQKDFYAQAGVAVEIVEFQSLADARRAFERGQIDGWGTTVVEVLLANAHSRRQPQILQVTDYSSGADVVMGHPRVESMTALKGAKIGVELGSVCVYVLGRALALNGLSLKDITPVSMDQTSMADAFGRGELDAVVTYPPFSITLGKTSDARLLFTSKEIPGEVMDVLALDTGVIKSRPDDVGKLIQAYQRALAYADANPADANAIMAKREGLSSEEFAHSLTEGITLVNSTQQAELLAPGGILERVVAATNKVLLDTGQIQQGIPATAVVDRRFGTPATSP